jgi:hypothetical protein
MIDGKPHEAASEAAEEELQSSFFYMLNCLLHSRMQIGMESNSVVYDEDVNMYLANLLNSFIDPNFLEASSKYVRFYDRDVYSLASKAPDDRARYSVYRTNADYLLMDLGIFNNLPRTRGSLLPMYHLTRDHYIGRAKAYYELAASYARQASRKHAPVSDTLTKISDHIEGYLSILSYLRGRYFDLIERFSPGELYHLQRSIDDVGHEELVCKKRDEFLEIYYAWLRTRSEDLRMKLLAHVRQLKKLDPDFDFELPA